MGGREGEVMGNGRKRSVRGGSWGRGTLRGVTRKGGKIVTGG